MVFGTGLCLFGLIPPYSKGSYSPIACAYIKYRGTSFIICYAKLWPITSCLCLSFVQVLLRSPPAPSGTVITSAVAAGGRYDQLLRSLWSPAAAALMPPPGAVGVSINCEKLIKLVLQWRRPRSAMAAAAASHGSNHSLGGVGLEGGERLPTSRCDVVVCARAGDGMLQMRMGLLAHLWSAGISAELVPKEAPSLTEQYEYAHGSGARWLVILDDKTIGPNQTVRVKSLERKGEDSTIHIAEIGRFLQLGLNGAQDPVRSIGGSTSSAFGHWTGLGSGGMLGTGIAGVSAAAGTAVGSAGTGLGASGSFALRSRSFHNLGSEGKTGLAVGDSTDAEYAGLEVGSGKEAVSTIREHRDREQQGGRYRDKRR
eukprot:GHRR01021775.1.p1 GENE.GHRR01021775.1~~GHRR01021775.1.p1  ORF type:complete len:370 (+),score=88.89 GHRR01021775.1:808-1917(+)